MTSTPNPNIVVAPEPITGRAFATSAASIASSGDTPETANSSRNRS
jgi:hypothetical protein